MNLLRLVGLVILLAAIMHLIIPVVQTPITPEEFALRIKKWGSEEVVQLKESKGLSQKEADFQILVEVFLLGLEQKAVITTGEYQFLTKQDVEFYNKAIRSMR